MHIKNKKGQSTVEYVLLVTAVVAVIILLVAGKDNGFQAQLTNAINTATGDMNTTASVMTESHTEGYIGNGVPGYSVIPTNN